MNAQSGSYQYDQFEEQTQRQEFERLYRQASTILDTERRFWPSAGIVTGQKVLDLGCGSGVVTRELAKQVYPTQVVGVDISNNLIDKGIQAYSIKHKSKKERVQNNVSFQQGSVYDLPFPDASFDVVYARLLFQHLSEPLQALSNVIRVLKPGGLICVVDVDKDWSSAYPEPQNSTELVQAMVQKQLSQGGDPWVGRKLSHYLKSAGLIQVQTTVKLVDSDQLGLARFFGTLAFGGKPQTEQSERTGQNEQSEQSEFATLQSRVRPSIQALLDNPYAWAGFGLFVATGRKIE